MNLKPYIAVSLAILSSSAFPAKEVSVAAKLTVDQIGEFVTIKGTAVGHFPPKEDRGPHAFQIKDKDGALIRVMAWPDIFENVKNKNLLTKEGTPVTITGEVTEYKGKLELQLQDWEEIQIGGETTATVSFPSDSGTTRKAVLSTPPPFKMDDKKTTDAGAQRTEK